MAHQSRLGRGIPADNIEAAEEGYRVLEFVIGDLRVTFNQSLEQSDRFGNSILLESTIGAATMLKPV